MVLPMENSIFFINDKQYKKELVYPLNHGFVIDNYTAEHLRFWEVFFDVWLILR